MALDEMDREIRAGTLTIRTHRNDSSYTIALAGELDLANGDDLSAELERVGSDGSAEMIILDMAELEFIDSTGIAILVAAHRRLNADGDRFQLACSKATEVCRVLALTGLDAAIPFLEQ
ncbi:MAG TPA: STAS domain-containing protein [Solirubrobacterales bacterium]|nr:STAS domain-containing protein [Solirubrobacterales bacterium]